MSADPVFDLHAAIVPKLAASAPLNALVAGRIYDDVPSNRVFPYVSIGPMQAISDDTDECMVGYEVTLQLDVWARGSTIAGTYERARPQMERIAGTVRNVLRAANLILESHILIEIAHQDTLYLRDPDGLTAHGAVTFRALINQL